jgi:hypothetical protein
MKGGWHPEKSRSGSSSGGGSSSRGGGSGEGKSLTGLGIRNKTVCPICTCLHVMDKADTRIFRIP